MTGQAPDDDANPHFCCPCHGYIRWMGDTSFSRVPWCIGRWLFHAAPRFEVDTARRRYHGPGFYVPVLTTRSPTILWCDMTISQKLKD
ncbi:hypothetical protein PoB_005486800 [Plakobranchus ocellatus]|uniref:Uncharacterized protein n=1 Tax=Plakobranchus ocellatus TaxID=259542 RepID=A0AAV4CBH9_9GAST|nr:hypothetical protein PoB_005486800 [Plakobranchus ocellatus]